MVSGGRKSLSASLKKWRSLRPLHLQRGPEFTGELDELVVEQRIADVDPGHVAHARYLAQVVVGERLLEVQVHHPVDGRGRCRSRVDLARIASGSSSLTDLRKSGSKTSARGERSRKL